MEKPFFSLVIGVYNGEKYLDEMIESVIGQGYKDWELILVDDGSTDRSGIICDRYAEDERIHVFHTENQGSLEARYYGLGKSRGEYVIVADADDRMVPECLETVKGALDRTGSDMILWGHRTFGEALAEVRCSLQPLRIYPPREVLLVAIKDTCHSLCLRAVRGDVIRNSCVCPLKHLTMNTDYAMIIPILCRSATCYVLEDILYEYRVYGDSISHWGTVQKIIDTGSVTEYAEKEIADNGLLDRELEKAIYVSYLKMIAGRLLSLFLQGAISRQDCGKIHRQKAYVKAKKYENRKNFGAADYCILWAFRREYYWIFKIARSVRNLKHRLKGKKHR